PDEGRHPESLHAVARRTPQLLFRQVGQAEGYVSDRDEPSVRPGAEIDDPTIVRPRICHRQLEVIALRLPQEPERGIQERALAVLDVEAPQSLLGVHRSERGVVDVPRACRLALVFDAGEPIHHAEKRRRAAASHLRRLAIDFEILETALVLANANGALTIF